MLLFALDIACLVWFAGAAWVAHKNLDEIDDVRAGTNDPDVRVLARISYTHHNAVFLMCIVFAWVQVFDIAKFLL